MKKIQFVFLLFPVLFYAQNLATSPYSRFGYGESKFDNDSRISAMGGIGVTYSDPLGRFVNFSNPAANNTLLYTSFESGLNIDLNQLKSKKYTDKNSSSYLANLSLGFPVGKRMAVAFGFQPYSGVGYNWTRKDETSISDGREKRISASSFQGDGGLNAANFSFSYAFLKKKELSIGMTGQYIFGNLNDRQIIRIKGSDWVTEEVNRNHIKGFTGILGGLYKYKVKRNKQWNLGASYTIGTHLKNDYDYNLLSYVTYLNGAPNPATLDTVLSIKNHSTVKLPTKTSLGVGYEKPGRWMIGAQYDFEETSVETLRISEDARYGDGHRFALGGYWIPKSTSYKSYFETVTYRAGIFYEKTGLSVLDNVKKYQNINNFGITFGMSLPVGKYDVSMLNIAACIGQRGTTNNGLIRENYVNLKISFNLSGIWFRRKIYY